MGIIKPLSNLAKYGSLTLLPQVDPDVMKPVFDRSIQKFSSYSPEDHLALWKTDKENLRFQYHSKRDSFVWFYGTVFACEPRKSFGNVDVVSFIEMNMVGPHEPLETCNVIQDIAKSAGVEKIVAFTGLGIEPAAARELANYRGHRLFNQLNLGLGAFTHG